MMSDDEITKAIKDHLQEVDLWRRWYDELIVEILAVAKPLNRWVPVVVARRDTPIGPDA